MDELDYGATIKGFNAGQKVFNRYVLNKILGRGGMGVVWLAKDEELGRETALKFLPEVVAMDPAAIGDLKREVRRAIELAHPHIVKIHDFVTDGRTAAVSMEYVTGQTLSSQRLDEPGQVFTVEKIGPWLSQLCSALDYAHQDAEVVHRDLKPTNLMIDGRGRLKVLDFGIAASISDSVSRVSNKGSTSGTPVYMSPQQMMGEDPAITDDVYALGATVFELLAGKPPFHAGNIVLQVQNKVAPLLNERRKAGGLPPVPPEWEQAIAACLAKDPKQRPQSAGELAQRLGVGTPGTWKSVTPPVLTVTPATAQAPAAAPAPVAATSAAAGSVPGKTSYYVWQPAFWALGISFGVVGLIGLIIGSDSSNDSIPFSEKLGMTLVIGSIASFFLWLLLMFVRVVFTKGPPAGPVVAKPKIPWLRTALVATFVPTLVDVGGVVGPVSRSSGQDPGTVTLVSGLFFLVIWFFHTLFYSIAQGALLVSKTRRVWAYMLTPAAVGTLVAAWFYGEGVDFMGQLKMSEADLAAGIMSVMSVWGLAGWISHRMLLPDRPLPGPNRRWWQTGAALALLGAAYFFFVSLPNNVQLAFYQKKQAELRVAEEAAQKETARQATEAAAKKLETAQRKKEAATAVQAAYKMVFDRVPDQASLDAYVERMLTDPGYDATRLRHEMRASPEGLKGGRVLVPAEFKTIQDAIYEAVPGNVVLVSAGTYTESLYLDKAIELTGAGRDQVTVQTDCTKNALYAHGANGATVTGFSFRHTDTKDTERRASLIGFTGSSTRFVRNAITAANGFGMYIQEGGTVTVTDNNISGARWAGVNVVKDVGGEISGNDIHDNGQEGLAIAEQPGRLEISRNTVRDNGSAGIQIWKGDGLTLVANEASGNGGTVANGGIGVLHEAGRPVLRGNIGRDNKGAGIWWVDNDRPPVIGAGNFSDGKELPLNR